MPNTSRANELLEQLRKTYVAELPSKIEEIELVVMGLARDADFQNGYENLFRRVHSLKGSAGTYGCAIIGTICHRLEDHLRLVDGDAGKRRTRDIDNWLAHIDLMRQGVNAILAGQTTFPEIERGLNAIQDDAFKTRHRAVIVEQSRSTLKLCASLVQTLTMDAVEFDDGLQALDHLLRDPVDLLVAGLELRSLNGMAVIAAIRLSGGVNKAVKAVLLTSKPKLDIPPVLQPVSVLTKGAELGIALERETRSVLQS
jgi:chemotaxis protein histidine kinase CheA